MVERVRGIVGGAPQLIFAAGPISAVLPDLVTLADGDGRRTVTVSNHGPAAEALGVRTSFKGELGYLLLGAFARLSAAGLARGARPQPERTRSRQARAPAALG